MIGCAALGALIAFFAVGRPPAQWLTVELLLALNVAALALLCGRSLPWPAILALLAAWRPPSLAPEEVQKNAQVARMLPMPSTKNDHVAGEPVVEPAEVHAEEAGDE